MNPNKSSQPPQRPPQRQQPSPPSPSATLSAVNALYVAAEKELEQGMALQRKRAKEADAIKKARSTVIEATLHNTLHNTLCLILLFTLRLTLT